LRAQQELIKDQAVRDERERIAREPHDVIAHSISAMVVQATAAQDLLPP
jgi:signal transduction histidine kinase